MKLRRVTIMSIFAGVLGTIGLSACATQQTTIPTVTDVDLERFAGDWYVIANIPTFIETQAYNAVESYAVPEGNRIDTRFTFNEGALDGPQKTYTPTAFVSDDSNGLWGMQFIWPFKAEYRIVHLDPDYQFTIVGRTRRDFVWVMARSPQIAEADYTYLIDQVNALGYDISKIRRVPHG